MYSKQITLNISGTKLRQAGFADLVILGAFPEAEFKNMDRVTLISEKPVYLIKHTNDYIFYQLIDRRVKSNDADTNGVLSIAVTIPSGMKLADGKSPYTLLRNVYDRFRSDYMTPYSDGRDTFLDVPADATVFSDILAGYSLERRTGRYVVMNAVLTGSLCVPQDKLEALFRDSQYNEFANYKDIEIGVSCESSLDLANLEIPRPIIYDVYVNGTRQSIVISKPTDLFSTNLPDHDNISFTLGDLLAADGNRITKGKSVVELDFVNNKITCTIAKSVFMLKCKVSISGKAKGVAKEALESGKLRILERSANFDIMQYRVGAGLDFDIPSDVILNPSFRLDGVEKCDLELTIYTNTMFDKRTINIDVNANPKEVAPAVVPPAKKNAGSKERSNVNSSNSFKDNREYERQRKQEIERKEREAEERRYQEQRQKEQKRNAFVMGFISALVLCGLCFAAYIWLAGDEKKKQQGGEVAQTVEDKHNEVDKVKIFSEVLKDKINNDKDFLKTEEVKQIVKKYNELNPPAPQDTVKEKVAAKINPNRGVDKNVVEADSTAHKNVAVALSKSEEQKAQTVDQIKAEILELVKKKDFNACQAHPGWNKLGQTDKNTVDYLLRTIQYTVGKPYKDGRETKTYNKSQNTKIMKYINDLNFEDFKTWADLEAAKDKIVKIRKEAQR